MVSLPYWMSLPQAFIPRQISLPLDAEQFLGKITWPFQHGHRTFYRSI
jgi:hypothetical protein